MDRVLYRTLLIFAATLFVAYGLLLVLSPFLVSIGWALCLAAITTKPYLALAKRWRKPRLAALVMVTSTALVILVPLALVLYFAGEEVVAVGQQGIESWIAEVKSALPNFHAWLNRQAQALGLKSVDEATTRVAKAAPAVLWKPVASGAWSVVGTVFTTAMGIAIMLATQFFVYTSSGRLQRMVLDLSPLPREDTNELLLNLRDTTASAVLGGVMVAFLQGMLGGVGFAIAGIQAPVLWGLVMAFFSLLPMGGAAIIWLPVVIYLFAVGQTGAAGFLLAWGTLVVGGIDNLIRPWLLRRMGSTVHPMLLFFAILSGIGLFGVSGIVFGPLLIAFVSTSIEIYRRTMGQPDASESEETSTVTP